MSRDVQWRRTLHIGSSVRPRTDALPHARSTALHSSRRRTDRRRARVTLATLPPARDVAALLVPFARALDRRRAYGPAHPVAREAATALHEALARRHDADARFVLQVARDVLLVDGEPLVGGTALARELALRLHRRGVGAITVDGTPPVASLHALLGHLCGDDDEMRDQAMRDDAIRVDATRDYARGAAHDDATDHDAPARTTWSRPGIIVAPLRYDRLVIGDGTRAAGDAAVSTCLVALARLAGSADILGGVGGAGADGGDPIPRLVRLLADPLHGHGIARELADALGALARTADDAPAAERAAITDGLSDMVQRLGPGAVHAIVAALDRESDRRAVLGPLVAALPADAIGDWVRVVADATGRSIAPEVLRLVGKLANPDGLLGRDAAEPALRDAARALVERWTIADPNPGEHRALLERIAACEARRAAADEARDGGAMPVPAPVEDVRLVALALELDVVTPGVHEAAQAMLLRGELVPLLAMLRRTPHARVTVAINAALRDGDAVSRVLLAPTVDAADGEALLALFGAESVPMLLDLLARAPRRETRRLVLARLRALGPDVAPLVVPVLATAASALARNLLLLLRDLGASSADAVQAALRRQDDPSVGVRAEALRFLAGIDAARGRAILRALRDPTPRVVRAALGAVADHAATLRHGDAPGYDVQTLLDDLCAAATATHLDERTQASAVLAAGAIGGVRVRDWLAALLVRRTRVLRRRVLARPSAVTIAALHVLRRHWRRDPVAADVLAIADRDARDERWGTAPALPSDEERP